MYCHKNWICLLTHIYYQISYHEFSNIGYTYVGVIMLKGICFMSDTFALICVLRYSNSTLQKTEADFVSVSRASCSTLKPNQNISCVTTCISAEGILQKFTLFIMVLLFKSFIFDLSNDM